VVFNIYALYQAIIGLVAVGIVHLLLLPFGYYMIGGTREAFVSLLIIAFVSAYTDIKGLKGKLFFIRSWIIYAIASIFVFSITYSGFVMRDLNNFDINSTESLYQTESLCGYQTFIVISIFLLIVFYVLGSRKQLKKVWAKKQQNLELLKQEAAKNGSSSLSFWVLASHVFYKPSNVFLFSNRVWTKIFKNTFDGNDFTLYYREYINLIDLESIPFKNHKKWLTEFKKALNNNSIYEYYQHPPMALARLGTLIDRMQNEFD